MMNPKLVKSVRKDFHRMIVYGASRSGKSFFVVNKLLPKIVDQYDTIVVFTLPENNGFYRKKIEKEFGKELYLINTKFLEALKLVREAQEKNVVKMDEDENPVFGSNILLIWDDVLSEKVLKSQEFIDQFTHMRHLFCSCILITQITNKSISPQLKSNATHTVTFRINNVLQRREILKMLASCIAMQRDDLGISYTQDELDTEARRLYMQYVIKEPFGFIAMDEFSNYFIMSEGKKLDEDDKEDEKDEEEEEDEDLEELFKGFEL